MIRTYSIGKWVVYFGRPSGFYILPRASVIIDKFGLVLGIWHNCKKEAKHETN